MRESTPRIGFFMQVTYTARWFLQVLGCNLELVSFLILPRILSDGLTRSGNRRPALHKRGSPLVLRQDVEGSTR